ncbi:MAG TPA: cytochrome b N-terminal domain-containing protein [Gemmatimonadales bacterium]
MNRVYGWRLNPLYHSGALTLALIAVVLITGVYLLFFYKISAPHESVARISERIWLGSWTRSLHRYASDAAVLAAAIHALRVFAQRRTWGPRALAWLSGCMLLFVIFVCGWTGYVMVWDVQGLVLAREGARLLDALPVFAEPIGRTFAGDGELPSAFFFLNLFLHVALPVGMAVLLWIHVARLARPALLPPKPLMWGVIGLLAALALLWPAAIAPRADVFTLAVPAPYDVFFSFWLPLTRAMPPWVVWAVLVVAGGAVFLLPYWIRPPARARPPASVVDENLCQGCGQCYLDCPYEAITMISVPDSPRGLVARVDPTMCVSCGICAGSCAPMCVGPPGRTGRDQLADVKAFAGRQQWTRGDVALVACDRGGGAAAEAGEIDGAPVFGVRCVGSLHTSVVEYLVRSGAGGVLIVACPARDCWNREGVTWMLERLYNDREAELPSRVDRRRVRVAYAGEAEFLTVLAELQTFRADVAALEAVAGESNIAIDDSCNPVPEEALR